jgi:hypothetical protein
MVENHKKCTYSKQKLKLIEKFENRELTTELARDYGVGMVVP